MAINKKLIHFNTFENFNSKRLSANKENTRYTTGIDGEEQDGSPEILYQSIVYIKDTKQQWTHGLIYSGSESSSECKNVYTFKYTGLSSITQEEWDAMQLAEVIQFAVRDFYFPVHVIKQPSEIGFIIANMDIWPIFDTYDSAHIISISNDLQVVVEHVNRSSLEVPIINTINKKLSLSNTSEIRKNCEKLLPWLKMTFMISDSNGNCSSRDTVYIDTEEMKLHLFHSAANAAVRLLFTNGEAYYYVQGFNIPLIGNIAGGWYSQSISKWIALPETPLKTARVGDFITFTRVDVPASDFYSKYIDFDSINLELSTTDRAFFNAYKSKLDLSSLSDGLFIKYLIVNGYINTCSTNPKESPSALLYPLAVDGMVTTYVAQITPNTENFYSGEFWTLNMTGPGIYSYVTKGRPAGSEDGEFYTGYVSPDGTQTLVSMKDPSKAYTRAKIGDTWTKLAFGVGKNIGGTGEIFNDYTNNKAHTDHAHAEGLKTNAYSYNAHAEGYNTQAGHNAHSEGSGTHAKGQNSHAEGLNTLAEGNNSHAEGASTKAYNENAHAEGDSTEAFNWNAHAEGYRTIASGNGAHAEGNSSGFEKDRWNIASGFAAHTEGGGTVASGDYTHAEGRNTTASGLASHAEGCSTQAVHNGAHAEGYGTHALGSGSHAEGGYVIAKGSRSHAEGNGALNIYFTGNNKIYTIESGSNIQNSFSFVKGLVGKSIINSNNTTIATVLSSEIADDGYTVSVTLDTDLGELKKARYIILFGGAYGDYSHSENISMANGKASHSQGDVSIANGEGSFTQGSNSVADGEISAVFGTNNYAQNNSEFALGISNHSHTGETSAEQTLFSVGCGDWQTMGMDARIEQQIPLPTPEDGKNAIEIMRNGDVWLGDYGDGVKLYDGEKNKIELPDYYNKSEVDLKVDAKQDNLVSGTNIKTINGESLLGAGDIIIEAGNLNANVQAVDTSETLDDVETNTYVKYVAQTLTEEQKAQVRENIGVGSTGNADYVKKEDLSDYYTKSEIDALLGDINTMLESIINK